MSKFEGWSFESVTVAVEKREGGSSNELSTTWRIPLYKKYGTQLDAYLVRLYWSWGGIGSGGHRCCTNNIKFDDGTPIFSGYVDPNSSNHINGSRVLVGSTVAPEAANNITHYAWAYNYYGGNWYRYSWTADYLVKLQ